MSVCTNALAQQQLIELKESLKDISDQENNKDSDSTLKEKLFQNCAKILPNETNILRKLIEIYEKNKSPVPQKTLSKHDLEKYDIQTLEKYANNGKVYAKRLLTAKIHFIESLKALYSIKDHNNPSSVALRDFIKHLSLCAQIEFIVAYHNKPIEDLVMIALNKKLSYDEDVRICYVTINMGDIDENIIFLNECLKIYPKNKFFWETRGDMYGFRGQFDKSIQDFNEALKLHPNDEEIFYVKAAAMSKLENIDCHKVIDAYNQFISIAPEDHRKIPECYYAMALQSFRNEVPFEQNFTEAKKYYQLGQNAEQKQLSFFLPYNSPNKIQIELMLQKEDIPAALKTDRPINKHLKNPYRINIIKKHREFIYDFNKKFKNKAPISTSWKPSKIQKSSHSLAGLKSICLRDMDPTTDKIYDKCVIDLKVIDIVGTTSSSLVLVVEDNNKDVERCFIYNSPLFSDIESANKLYGAGSQFSVINPYLRMAADVMPAIRIDDIKSIVMRDFVKDMCRYCCEPNATKLCSRCHKALYCSRECQVNDYKLTEHKLICCQT